MEAGKKLSIGAISPRDTRAEKESRGEESQRIERFPGVVIDIVPGLQVLASDRGPGWHHALKGAKQAYLDHVPRLVEEHGWDGVTVPGAPVELMNPGLHRQLQAMLDVPVTTAMVSCAAALRAFGAERALLITGFFEGLDEMLYGYYVRDGVELVWPTVKPFVDYDEGSRRTSPETIFELTRDALERTPDVQAVYFQGAINNRPIERRVESELGLPVVSSITACEWHILSRLGARRPIEGAGRLLEEWPPLPSDA